MLKNNQNKPEDILWHIFAEKVNYLKIRYMDKFARLSHRKT